MPQPETTERTAAGRVWTQLAVMICDAITADDVSRATKLSDARSTISEEFAADVAHEKEWWGITS